MNIQNLKNKINGLTVNQKKELIDHIKESYSVFDEYSNVEKCPYCQSTHFVKNGKRKGVQRYKCKSCNKSFIYKTNTVLYNIKKINKWNDFVEDFLTLNISTIKQITYKLDISIQTAINWRHKLLSALVAKYNTFENETIEFDEIFMLISRKGRRGMNIKDYSAYRIWRESQVGDSDYAVKVFFTYSRDKKKMDLYTSHMGRTKVKDLENYFLPNKFKNIIVITDKHRSYASFFKRFKYNHKSFKSKYHIDPNDKSIHNQTVNAYAHGFKSFINREMHGVSTKYLDFYVKWFEFMINVKKQIESKIDNYSSKIKFDLTDKICENILADNNGLEFFRQSEISFDRFLNENGRTNWGVCSTHYYAA
jgi:transposase-like protein